jgi:thioredoxin reductase
MRQGATELFVHDGGLDEETETSRIVVIGAGPIGMAAAVHLLAAGERPIVLEAGPEAASHVKSWAHVPMFSPWRSNIDGRAAELLVSRGWELPPRDQCPTGREFYDLYLRPLASVPQVKQCIRLNARVTGVAKARIGKGAGRDRQAAPFEVRYVGGDGIERRILSQFVIDASGTWGKPCRLGASGLPALGEASLAGRISYGMPDILGAERDRFAGKRVLVVGSGYSALGNLLSLSQLADTDPVTTTFWAMRTDRREALSRKNVLGERAALGKVVVNLAAEGCFEVITPFAVEAVQPQPSGALAVTGASGSARRTVVVDEIIASTGLRGDLQMLEELQLDLDPQFECAPGIAPLINPEIHTCGSVALHGAAELQLGEPNFFLAGMKSYGRTPTFLLANGYEQARSLAAWMSRDTEDTLPVRPLDVEQRNSRRPEAAEPAE